MENTLFYEDLVESERILYTPSLFAKSSLLHLQEIGKLRAQKQHTSQRAHLASYLFFTVLSGFGTLEYNHKLYYLNPGDCVFIDCRNPYAHRTSQNLWTLQWIHFDGPFLANVYEKYMERGGQPVFHPADSASFLEIWQVLYDTAVSVDYIRDMRINEYLNCILTLLMKESWNPEVKRINTKKQNLLEIRNYLDLHYTEKVSLDTLAETFFINKFYLTRIFKEQFGISITNYLLQKRITHAKHLLRFTDKTVEAIGFECGMGAVHYFSKTFKRIEGIPPGEYRRLW